jgi:hypothetical protein
VAEGRERESEKTMTEQAQTGGEAALEPIDLTQSGLKPQTMIAIAVDTAYVAGSGAHQLQNGIYMMDNHANIGSENEGQLELSTVCNVGDLVAFRVYPVDQRRETNGGSVVITGIEVKQGDVFGSSGYPRPYEGETYWIGRAEKAGRQTYTMALEVTSPPVPEKRTVNVSWDPFLHTAGS